MAGGNEDAELPPPKTGDIDVLDLVPCCGLCCCILSCYTEMPDCLGSVCEYVLCCCSCKFMTCKTSKEANSMCKVLGLDWLVVPFSSCCQARGQLCCIESRVSFPPTPDFPCIVTICCLTLNYDYKCLCTCGKDIMSMHEKLDRVYLAREDSIRPAADDWQSGEDPETGRTYYYNKVTGKSQWHKPQY